MPQVHRDALRRIPTGTCSATIGEALCILSTSGAAPHAHLLLFLTCGSEQAVACLQSDLASFFLRVQWRVPVALERILGN